MFTINFKKFDEQGYIKAERKGTEKYTKREAIEVLKNNGFYPIQLGKTVKLPNCWTNGRGTNAHICSL